MVKPLQSCCELIRGRLNYARKVLSQIWPCWLTWISAPAITDFAFHRTDEMHNLVLDRYVDTTVKHKEIDAELVRTELSACLKQLAVFRSG